MRYFGIDVDRDGLVVACWQEAERTRFANRSSDHRRLRRWIERQAPARVCLEATGNYSLDVALALHAAKRIEVMVVNPRASKSFGEALQVRSRDDDSDAAGLAEYAARMPFVAWVPPSPACLALRQLTREAVALSDDLTAAKNRYHAASATQLSCKALLGSMRRHIAAIEARIDEIEQAGLELVAQDDKLKADLALIVTVSGFAQRSALRVLGELACRSEPLEPRQIVAFAGLDVITHSSGASVEHAPHISKRGNAHLRRAVYMPALVAIRCEPLAGAFYRRLLGRGLKPLQAITAVMRKLLHAISAVLRHRTAYDPNKLFHNHGAANGALAA